MGHTVLYWEKWLAALGIIKLSSRDQGAQNDQGCYSHTELDKWLVQPRILTPVNSGRCFPTRFSVWAEISFAIGRISPIFSQTFVL